MPSYPKVPPCSTLQDMFQFLRDRFQFLETGLVLPEIRHSYGPTTSVSTTPYSNGIWYSNFLSWQGYKIPVFLSTGCCSFVHGEAAYWLSTLKPFLYSSVWCILCWPFMPTMRQNVKVNVSNLVRWYQTMMRLFPQMTHGVVYLSLCGGCLLSNSSLSPSMTSWKWSSYWFFSLQSLEVQGFTLESWIQESNPDTFTMVGVERTTV